MSLPTADLCDEFADGVHVMEPLFKGYGKNSSFCGPVVTLKLFEDNSLVRQVLSEPGEGRVLVVDGGGSLRCALVGDRLAQLAVDNDWAGIVVNGCIRDSDEISRIEIGIKALNTNPRKSIKRGLGERDVSVEFAGVTVRAGTYLYSDSDGVIVAENKLQPGV